MMDFLQGASVLVLGLGESGWAMARWCARFGAAVAVWDSRDAPPNAAALARQLPPMRRLDGALTDEMLGGVQLVLRSPGLSARDDRIRGPLERARATGIAVQGELDLFARALADLKTQHGYAPRVLAITGTNGKTTTTAMTALLVARTGRRVAAAGNIGPTMLQTLAEALDAEAAAAASANPVGATDGKRAAPPSPPDAAPVFTHLPEVWVLELSSFQLDGVRGFEPDAATVLNLSEDHLDWHGTMADYLAAKRNVFGERAVMVVNRDDPLVESLVPPPPEARAGKSRKPVPVGRSVVRFGLDVPRRPGDFGLVEEHGIAWLARARAPDETERRSRGGKGGISEAEDLQLQRLMPADALRLRGRHNAANALAALALATAIGCALAPMLHGLREYAGEPHRVQFVASVDGIDAFDDSKGTNVGATVAALNGLGADRAPARLAVILGGDGKGQDFAPLAAPVRRHARAVALIGRDAALIESALGDPQVPVQHHASLQAAVRWCFDAAERGDVVLLSPACASLDMFRSYVHRAEVFVAEVQSLVAGRGGVVA